MATSLRSIVPTTKQHEVADLKQTEKLAEGSFPLAHSLEAALHGASAVIIGTAHKQFRFIEPKHIAKLVKRRLASDYFGILNRTRWEKKGFEFI